MKTEKLVLVVVILVVVLVTVLLTIPQIRVSGLEKALNAAEDAETAASIARAILKTGTQRGKAAIAKYATAEEMCAFGATHQILLLGDANTGVAYFIYNSPPGGDADTRLFLRR